MAYAVSFDGERCKDGVVVETAVPDPAPKPVPDEAEKEERDRDPLPWRGGILGGGLLGGPPDERLMRAAPWYSRDDGNHVPSLVPSPVISFVPSPPAPPKVVEPPREWVRYRSDRMIPIIRTLGGAGSALAIKFAIAEGDDALLAFMDEWGIPDFPDSSNAGARKRMSMEIVRGLQTATRLLLDYHREGDPRADAALPPTGSWAQLRPVLVRPRRGGGGKPVLTLQTQSLVGFMALEIGTMVAGGAKVLRCDHCSKIYATGDYEGRHRRVGRFCSNRCRVADQRARAKAAGK